MSPGIADQVALVGHGPLGPRAAVAAVADAGLAACDPGRAVDRLVSVDARGVTIAGVLHPLAPGASVLVLGAGKASFPIAAALEAKLGDRLRGGVVVVRDGSGPRGLAGHGEIGPGGEDAPRGLTGRGEVGPGGGDGPRGLTGRGEVEPGGAAGRGEDGPRGLTGRGEIGPGGAAGRGEPATLAAAHPLRRIEVLAADHPLPSARSEAAAQRLLALAQTARPDDLVLACFTGGSSALVCSPPTGVTLAEKRELHRLLLAAGLPVVAVNAVRKHVSNLKGGRLAQVLAGRRIVNLTVSDVVGDHLDAITDPTVADTTSPADAERILRDAGLWDEVAPSIRRHLTTPEAVSPALEQADIHTVMLADGRTACEAMSAAATAAGYTPLVLSTALEGEARELGRLLGTLVRESALHGRPFAGSTMLLGCGGETTVTLRDGAFGDGGPNQEVALAFALALDGAPSTAGIFLDTDGSDGGTAIAGALVDGGTARRAAALGLDLAAELRAHRAGGPLHALGDAVVTGPTHTNVNDLFAIAIGDPRETT